MIETAVQVLGKVLGKIQVPAGADEETFRIAVIVSEKFQAGIAAKRIVEIIDVAGRLVKLVAN